MTTTRLSRSRHGRAAPPVRLVHLGLGNFYRAHQAWYTDRAPDAHEWGYAAFTGRTAAAADALEAQQGLYTLVTRARSGDRFEVIGSISRAHPAADHDSWLAYFSSASLAAVTITVTEAGYFRRPDGGLDTERPEVRADIEALRTSVRAPVATAPARLLAGLAARHAAGVGPITLMPCDNVAGNGAIVERVVRDLADAVDPGLLAVIDESVSIVTTMVDRITPRTTPDDIDAVRRSTGVEDLSPVISEPFHEWVLSGTFPAGRPRWESQGATFTDDILPFEHRKLWLLNGAHSLLAYAATMRGHTTVAGGIADPSCVEWVEEWWGEASGHLAQPDEALAGYRAALLERFANPRIRHLLTQIAADGSQKLPIRILPALRAERAAGRLPTGAIRVVAAWLGHLRGHGAAVADARAADVVPLATGSLGEAARRVVAALDPALADDDDVIATAVEQCRQLEREMAR